ncbi:MAG: DUF3536 domain-containing protein, partial [Deltaproteobacteria bacterium]|nr:DUF3536 domain-containing protein [Deltaproteobacteria bacterium]
MASPRYLVIHGHFYQPPRENPWSGTLPVQPSAAPYHDWNERVSRECYGPNTRARILNSSGKITKIINNYAHINFNMGPTLMSWMKSADPVTLELIAQADRMGSQANGGHGPAIAQVFNHIIMPLANFRDKQTQVLWGVGWFKHTFGRAPEGMWLAETAVDTETLATLSRAGIKFTILAQNQVDAIRPLSDKRHDAWQATSSVDPRQPYRVFWGRGASDFIDVFVYDGPVSRSIAFENLLRDGKAFKARITEAFGAPYPEGRPRLVNLATDGESYGHHCQFGEMALAWLIENLADGPDPIKLTTYGQYLAQFPPTLEARIVECSSWSCAHGVERWRSDCGCHIGGGAGWNQKWRTPLRDGLNWLQIRLADIFETHGSRYLENPYEARDNYIEVLASNYDEAVREAFLDRFAKKNIDAKGRQAAMIQLEAQLMSLYMFTSCGWFFDDLAGLEPVQNLRYAQRAIALVGELSNSDLTEGLLAYLRRARPNDPAYLDGEAVWNKLVAPESLPIDLCSAHWAAASIFGVKEALAEFIDIKFTELEATLTENTDGARMLAGRVAITDRRLGEPSIEKTVSASTDQGGRNLIVTVSDPGQSGETIYSSRESKFSLDTLWPSVRQGLLSDLVTDFFADLRSYTQKAFSHSRELLVQYSQTTKPLDWLSRFVFRVVAETKLDAFLGTMEEGKQMDLARLSELLGDREMGGSFQNEPVLNKAAQNYLKKLYALTSEIAT